MKRSITLLLLIIVPFVVFAQSTTGNLEGWVVDTAGAAIVGANVQVTSEVLQGSRGGVTDDVGHFRILALPPGVYSVRVSYVASQPFIMDNVRVLLGRTASMGEIALSERKTG